MLVLFTDTDTDITPQKAAEYGYHLISMPYSIDGKTTYPYVDFDEFDAHAYYDMLRNGVLPNTSAISEEQYVNYFEPVFREGNDILYVHFSSAMTMTFDVMKKAVDSLLEKYPERKFYQIDTKGISALSYAIVLEVGELYKAGTPVEEILSWAEKEVDKWTIYFTVDDLKFFHHSGRVSGLSATMGTLLGIRPIIYMSSEGKMEAIGKEKGRNKALKRIIRYMEEYGDEVENHRIVIGHTDAEELAEQMKEGIKERFGDNLDIEIITTNPTTGAHSGPDGIGVVFHGTKRGV